MSISALVQNVATALLTPLLPQSCLLCAADSSNALLCPDCASGLPSLPAGLCPACALPTPNGETCGACLKRPPHFDATVAAFAYAFPVDKLVQQLKYSHRLAIADFFAATLFDRGLPAADLVIPLPLSGKRLRSRGFNQSVEIARPLARALEIPLLLDGCARVIDTVPQTMLPWKERRRNVHHAFECSVDLTNKSVIVVDDVMTTGATLDEFARVLKDHGAARVTAVVVARALKGPR
jgi:ComF family protein